MSDIFGAFHFLRPLWVLVLVPVVVLWWQARPRKRAEDGTAAGVAPHLARALTVGREAGRGLYPIDGVALVLGLLVLAAAGPSWTRAANPLLASGTACSCDQEENGHQKGTSSLSTAY